MTKEKLTILEWHRLARKQFDQDRGAVLNVLHYNSGCVTEIAELVDHFKKHIFYNAKLQIYGKGGLLEELGDYFWYAVAMNEVFSNDGNSLDLNLQAIQMMENSIIRNFPTYRTNAETQLRVLIDLSQGRTTTWVKDLHLEIGLVICDFLGLDLDEVLKANIAKLTARYGDKFSNEKALNRDLQKEEETLKAKPAIHPTTGRPFDDL